MIQLSCNPIETLAVAAVAVAFGLILQKKWKVIDRYNLPPSVIGGIIFCLLFFILRNTDLVDFKFDKTFQEPLMIAFFASIGFNASYKLLKDGGKWVAIFLGLSVIGLTIQMVIGVSLAALMNQPLLVGVITSAVSLVGGPGTALAFAPSFEAAGISNATTLGLASAMGGILIGGLVGTPFATHLINKFSLKTPGKGSTGLAAAAEELINAEAVTIDIPQNSITAETALRNMIGLAVIMGIGSVFYKGFQNMGWTLPIYIGSMAAAAIVRNIDDYKSWFKLSDFVIEELGGLALTLFIGMAMITLDLSSLKSTALVLPVMLFVQTLLVLLAARYLVFRFVGKDYEAAITSAGYIGFMMGTTANAMANMNTLVKRYGKAPKSFLMVPIVGSCFIDFVNAAFITFCLNHLK